MQLTDIQRKQPFFHVTISQIDISSWISSISINETDQKPDSATIKIPDPGMVYMDVFKEGMKVTLDMGYLSEHTIMMKGHITKIGINFPQNGVPDITLTVLDESNLMTLKKRKITWDNKKVASISDIVKKIASNYNFKIKKIDIEDDEEIDKDHYLQQNNETDMKYLNSLAKRLKCRHFVEYDYKGQGYFYFISENKLIEKVHEKEMILRYRMTRGSNLLSFSPTINVRSYPEQKQITTLDPKTFEQIKNDPKFSFDFPVFKMNSKAIALWVKDHPEDIPKINSLIPIGISQNISYLNKYEKVDKPSGNPADKKANLNKKNKMSVSLKNGMTASGTTIGNIWLRAKSCVTIESLPSRFNGRWYVYSATHSINSSGYMTNFQCSR